jgi:signal peptidase I
MQNAANQQKLKDVLGIVAFIVGVIVGAWLINSLVFRSFSVSGPSMENTLYTGDRLIVNRLPMTWAALQHKDYVPSRGHVIVFRNPLFQTMQADEYIVKRVIAFGGERVRLQDGKVTVYNDVHPDGFDPYAAIDIPKVYITGETDTIVGQGDIFVIGDHRNGEYSLDSRNGLGTVPLTDVVGPVAVRIFPFNKVSNDF